GFFKRIKPMQRTPSKEWPALGTWVGGLECLLCILRLLERPMFVNRRRRRPLSPSGLYQRIHKCGEGAKHIGLALSLIGLGGRLLNAVHQSVASVVWDFHHCALAGSERTLSAGGLTIFSISAASARRAWAFSSLYSCRS